MANDSDWVADVRRWVRATAAAADRPAVAPLPDHSAELGYEAADPALQAPHWSATPATNDRRNPR